jgi:hypothetical protein
MESPMPRHQVSAGTADSFDPALPASDPGACPDHSSADIALLAATALGFAFSPFSDDEVQTNRLALLAEPHPELLTRAQATVLSFEIGSGAARTRAAELLRNAASSATARDRTDQPDDASTGTVHLLATMAGPR